MDAFNLKKDNRKKFQDKQKLKRRHATQSDLKYRKLNKEQQQNEKNTDIDEQEEEEEEVPPPLPSNEDRYTQDILQVDPEQDLNLQATSQHANKIIRKKLEMQSQEEGMLEDTLKSLQIKDPHHLKKSDIMSLDVQSLNQLLGRDSGNDNHPSTIQPVKSKDFKTKVATTAVPSTPPTIPEPNQSSMLPDELKEDEEFLDSLF